MAASVGTLKAFLTLDSQGWLAGFSKAGSATKSFVSSAITPVVSRLGAAATAIAGTVISVRSLAHSFESIDRGAKLADRLGISNEAVQKLGLAADLAGTDVETLAKAMLTMGHTIGSGGQSLDKRFFQMADAIAKIQDPGKRAKAAQEIFGKGGFELINVLAQGGKGIRQSADAIDRFGLGISRVDASKVEAANDALTTMGTVLKGVSDRIAIELSPSITHFVNQWLEGMELINRSGSMFEGWGTAASKVFDEVLAELAGFQEAASQLWTEITTGINPHPGQSPIGTYFDTVHKAWAGMQAARAAEMGVAGGGLGFGRLSPLGITGHVERPGAFERGSVEAARAIQSTSDKNQDVQFDILQQLKEIRAALDPMKRDGRGDVLRLAEAGI